MSQNYAEIPIINRMTIVLDEILKARNGITAVELSKRVSIPKTTLYRLLTSMTKNGFITTNGNSGVYRLGSKFADNYFSVNNRYSRLKVIARPILRRLADRTGETIKLSILSGLQTYTLLNVEGNKPIRIRIDTGALFPLHAGATGKIFLSTLTKDEVEYYMHNYGRKYSDKTIVDIDHMMEELEKVKENGYARDIGEYLNEISAVAVPIYDEFGDFLAVISLTFPTISAPYMDQDALIADMKSTSEEITDSLKAYVDQKLDAKLVQSQDQLGIVDDFD